MAVVNLPNSPSDGATQDVGGITYTYRSSKGYWTAAASSGGGGGGGGGGASVTSSDTAPSSPSAGDLWYKSDTNALYVYYTDADSSQWVGVSGPAGAAGADGTDGTDGSSATPASYTNFAGFPSSNNTLGDFAVAQDTKALYMWDGTEWDRIAAGSDETPYILTEPATSLALSSIGGTSTVTMVATDPEGFDIEYGIAYNNSGSTLPAQLASATTINQTTGVYTFTPTTTQSNAGQFVARLSASDGVKSTTRFTTISLGFSEDIIFQSAEPGVSSTLTNTTTGWGGAVSSNSGMAQSDNLRTGKRYFELNITNASGGYFMGLYDESNTNPGYNDSDGPALYYNGNVYPTGTYSGMGLGNIYASYPTTLMFAYDTAARKVWMGMNGTWGTGSGSPATGSGYTVGGTGALTFCLGNGSSGGNATITGNISLGANQTYAVPSGFSTH